MEGTANRKSGVVRHCSFAPQLSETYNAGSSQCSSYYDPTASISSEDSIEAPVRNSWIEDVQTSNSSKGFRISGVKRALGSGLSTGDHPDIAAGLASTSDPTASMKAQASDSENPDGIRPSQKAAMRHDPRGHRQTMVAADPANMPAWRVRLIEVMKSGGPVEAVTALVIISNSVVMALESEMPEAADTWEIIDPIFLVYYSVELFCRAMAFRTNAFKGIANHLDWTIVCVGWLQIMLAGAAADQMSAMNALKVLRALRVLRCIRMLQYVEGLWLVVQSFFYCLKPLMWVCLFMIVIVFIFAMFSVEMIGNSPDFKGVPEQEYFTRTVSAFVTLFQIMTLDEWRNIIQPLCDKAGWAYLFFFVYISISALALMNLITAVVVENSMKRIEADEEYKNMMFERASQLETEKITSLLEFFGMKNTDPSPENAGNESFDSENLDEGVVRPDDLLKAKGAWSALENVLVALELDEPEDVQRLFELLDSDGNGELSLNEVIDGLLQLRTITEDKYKAALIQAMPSHDGKFEVLDRFCQHLPETGTRKIRAMEGRMSKIHKELFARIEEVQVKMKDVTDSQALRSLGLTSDAFEPPSNWAPPEQACTPDQEMPREVARRPEEMASPVTIEVLNLLRTLRTEVGEQLQHQAMELRRQGGELKKHQETVDQLVKAMEAQDVRE